jgi:hypothetical protein
MHHGSLARRAEDGHVQRLRHEGLAEVEVEDVRLREIAGERSPLHDLLAKKSMSRQIEVDVVLVGPPPLRPEDEQARVDALAPQRVHVRPAGAGEVDREVEDAGVDGRNDTIRRRARRPETAPLSRCA